MLVTFTRFGILTRFIVYTINPSSSTLYHQLAPIIYDSFIPPWDRLSENKNNPYCFPSEISSDTGAYLDP